MRSKSWRARPGAKGCSSKSAPTSLIQPEFTTNYARAQRQNPIWAQVVTKWFCGAEHGVCMQRRRNQKTSPEQRRPNCVGSLCCCCSWVNLQHARNIGSIHAAPLIGYVRGPSEAKISPPREAESKTAAELCANLGWQKSKWERRLGVFAINFRPPAPT